MHPNNSNPTTHDWPSSTPSPHAAASVDRHLEELHRSWQKLDQAQVRAEEARDAAGVAARESDPEAFDDLTLCTLESVPSGIDATYEEVLAYAGIVFTDALYAERLARSRYAQLEGYRERIRAALQRHGWPEKQQLAKELSAQEYEAMRRFFRAPAATLRGVLLKLQYTFDDGQWEEAAVRADAADCHCLDDLAPVCARRDLERLTGLLRS